MDMSRFTFLSLSLVFSFRVVSHFSFILFVLSFCMTTYLQYEISSRGSLLLLTLHFFFAFLILLRMSCSSFHIFCIILLTSSVLNFFYILVSCFLSLNILRIYFCPFNLRSPLLASSASIFFTFHIFRL